MTRNCGELISAVSFVLEVFGVSITIGVIRKLREVVSVHLFVCLEANLWEVAVLLYIT